MAFSLKKDRNLKFFYNAFDYTAKLPINISVIKLQINQSTNIHPNSNNISVQVCFTLHLFKEREQN